MTCHLPRFPSSAPLAPLALLLGCLTCAARATLPVETPHVSQAGVQSAFQILRQDYIRSRELTLERLNHAALLGLLDQLGTGARLVPREISPAPKQEPDVLHAVLDKDIGWLRPVSFSLAEIPLAQQHLRSLIDQGCTRLILDLRSPAAPGSFETASGLLDLFFPPGQTLFRLVQAGSSTAEPALSSTPAAWTGPLVVLIDRTSNNTAETVAAVLHQQQLALLVGQPTPGATVRYQNLPLDADWNLQYASAEMFLVDGRSLFQVGLTPDLEVAMSDTERATATARMSQGRVRELVHEVARARFNEADLVARRNPEIESYLRRSLGQDDTTDKVGPTDPILQRAVDMLRANENLSRSRLQWQKAAEVPETEITGDRPPKAIPVPKP